MLETGRARGGGCTLIEKPTRINNLSLLRLLAVYLVFGERFVCSSLTPATKSDILIFASSDRCILFDYYVTIAAHHHHPPTFDLSAVFSRLYRPSCSYRPLSIPPLSAYSFSQIFTGPFVKLFSSFAVVAFRLE